MVSYYLRLYKFDIFLRIKEMNILKKIGTPFIAVWRWIKETAWVQPLLIVGIIFAIIFSIPSITRGIQGLVNQTESDLVYFSERQLSLEGSKVTEDHAPDSAANIFFDDFVEAQSAWGNGNKEEAREIMSSYSNNGDKFFLFFVQDECTGCSSLKEGCEYLEDNWSRYVRDENEPGFYFQSIVVDQEIDDDYYEEENKHAIDDLVTYRSYLEFYRIVMSNVANTRYYINVGIRDGSSGQNTIYSNTEALIDTADLQTPTIMLIDLTDNNETSYIVSEVFYTSDTTFSAASEVYDKAQFIADAWTYQGVFGKDYH